MSSELGEGGVAFLEQNPRNAVTTRTADSEALATSIAPTYAREWERIIDEKLVEWGREPAALAEEDLYPPTPAAIQRASDIAMRYRAEVSPPQRVIPDGDGGIILEWWNGSRSNSIEIDGDGHAELVVLERGKVAYRLQL